MGFPLIAKETVAIRTSSGTSVSVNIGTPAANNRMVIIVGADIGNQDSEVISVSGFTKITEGGDASRDVHLAYFYSNSYKSGTVTATWSGSAYGVIVALEISNVYEFGLLGDDSNTYIGSGTGPYEMLAPTAVNTDAMCIGAAVGDGTDTAIITGGGNDYVTLDQSRSPNATQSSGVSISWSIQPQILANITPNRCPFELAVSDGWVGIAVSFRGGDGGALPFNARDGVPAGNIADVDSVPAANISKVDGV